MDKADLQAVFVAAGLSRLVKDIDRLARPSIRITAAEVDESLLYVGASKLGGVPDLPTGAAWPEWKGLPQSFIAQIRLDDVGQYDTEKVLPQSGMLWFFYDAQQQTFGEDPADRGGWQVLYTDGDLNALQRALAPTALPATSQYHACLLRKTKRNMRQYSQRFPARSTAPRRIIACWATLILSRMICDLSVSLLQMA